MLLSTLLDRVHAAGVSCVRTRGRSDRPVGRVTDTDGDVGPDDVFVAIRGARVDGHDRLAGLGHAGAVVVERDVPVPEGPTVVRVDNTRRALAWMCAARLDEPGRAVPVVGVTGTNGKTSTTFLVAAMARAAGRRPGIIGTTGHLAGDTRIDTKFTTPTAPETQSLLARMRDEGCGLVAMEVSSIGLAAFRADGIPFAAAAFTNLTRDHLDYHGTMDAYAAAKARLFHELCAGRRVLNAADPASARMFAPGQPTWWFGPGRDLDARDPRPARLPDGRRATAVRLRTPVGEADATFPLIGAHNVENVLAALGLALAVGLPLDACVDGLARFGAVPGRLEAVPTGRGFDLYVDYAHTPDALERVLATLRALGPRRILTVFGCGGDRDPGKRPEMGRVAEAGSDLVVITSDNPRGEDPAAIVAQIRAGFRGAPPVEELDRRAAIARAIALAGPGDLVLVAGKGHETTQTIGDSVLPFDDRVVARELLSDAA